MSAEGFVPVNGYTLESGNPVRSQDPRGTDIYLKTGNNSGNPVNDAIHQNVCVDTWDAAGCEKTGIACFSFGHNSNWGWFSVRRTWLGWRLSFWETTGGLYMMEGEIYEADDAGKVDETTKTTPAQDQRWLDWMRTKRVGTKDVYTVGWFNCRKYSQREFADAPGDH